MLSPCLNNNKKLKILSITLTMLLINLIKIPVNDKEELGYKCRSNTELIW